MKYIGITWRYPDNGHNTELGPFDTPEEAFKAAKDRAESFGFAGICYWVETENPFDGDPELEFFDVT